VWESHVTWGTPVQRGTPGKSLPRPFGFRFRADVRDIRQTDRQTTDADHRLMPPPLWGGGIINKQPLQTKKCSLDEYSNTDYLYQVA